VVLTAFLALVGKSQPGTFLKATAYVSAANLSITACQFYGERELNRGVFKLNNIEPKPGKLWERTKHWTVDDTVVGGGLLGTFLALNPRALPGVGGWKRIFGAATVGCAVGGFFGQKYLVRVPPPLVSMVHLLRRQNRSMQYARLKEDTKAQESLSRIGKLALAYYTWPILGISLNPFAGGAQYRQGGLDGGGQMPFQNAHAGISQQEMDQYTHIQIEFSKGELKGPDVEHGYRAYKDSLTDRDEADLQDWLERLREVRKVTANEAQYVWQHLAKKELEFYGRLEDDREKDIVRREIQLLNNMASDFAIRDSIFAYHIADAMKRLAQMDRAESTDQNLLLTAKAVQDELPGDWREHYSPHLVTDHVRLNWSRQKELLGFLEQATTMHGDVKPEPGTPGEAHLKSIQENAENMKKNVEATERLLKEFEEQVRRADEHVEK
jgi:hypothetical protein